MKYINRTIYLMIVFLSFSLLVSHFAGCYAERDLWQQGNYEGTINGKDASLRIWDWYHWYLHMPIWYTDNVWYGKEPDAYADVMYENAYVYYLFNKAIGSSLSEHSMCPSPCLHVSTSFRVNIKEFDIDGKVARFEGVIDTNVELPAPIYNATNHNQQFIMDFVGEALE